LVAFCLSHVLADFIICTCVFDFRQAQECPSQNPTISAPRAHRRGTEKPIIDADAR
jgi:hypothetical protein